MDKLTVWYRQCVNQEEIMPGVGGIVGFLGAVAAHLLNLI